MCRRQAWHRGRGTPSGGASQSARAHHTRAAILPPAHAAGRKTTTLIQNQAGGGSARLLKMPATVSSTPTMIAWRMAADALVRAATYPPARLAIRRLYKRRFKLALCGEPLRAKRCNPCGAFVNNSGHKATRPTPGFSRGGIKRFHRPPSAATPAATGGSFVFGHSENLWRGENSCMCLLDSMTWVLVHGPALFAGCPSRSKPNSRPSTTGARHQGGPLCGPPGHQPAHILK